ncbi:MAG: hypothetical protein INR64_15015 [Caulobacteraceae bacterium]|nr:hypothetical protein [Caulobacter sp.]
MILLGSALTILVCTGAIWKGGPPERSAAVAFLVTLAVATVLQLVIGRAVAWPVVIADLVLGFGMVACAALHPQRWLYVAVGLAAALLLVHAFLLDGEAIVTPAYRALVDGLNLLLLAMLAWATWRRWRGKRAA